MIDCGLLGLRARGEYHSFQLGDGKLPIGLAEWNQSNSSGHQIRDVTLQEGGQGQANWNILACRASSKNDGQGRWNFVAAEYVRKPVQDAIGPYPAQRCKARRRLLGRLERQFRRAAKGGRQLRNLEQSRAVIAIGAAPGLAEEDRLISSRAVTKVGFQPIDESLAVTDVPSLDSPFKAMGIAV